MQDMFAGFTRDIRMILKYNFILSQGAGFIGAQNIHCAKVLDSVEVFNDNLLF